MYRAFNLKHFIPHDGLYEAGVEQNKRNSNAVKTALEAFLDGGTLDATSLGEHWFPEIKSDIFISHSHKDRHLAIAISGWITKRFGLNAFVDSSVWGNSTDLLKQVDKIHCWDETRDIYIYERRNESTSHVHMLLATALGQMLNNTECVLFVNSPNSISTKQAVDKTYSPWIFYELAMMRLIERRPAEDHRPLMKTANFSAREHLNESLMQYDADLSALTTIDVEVLNEWQKRWVPSGDRHPLDTLYKLAPDE